MPKRWPDWLSSLSDEDLNFLRRFLLHSGSLKAVASEYEVSYPTVRLRLDRLIQKVHVAEEAANLSPFERTLRLLLADQAINAETYKTLLEAHQHDETP
ncbi:MAG: DUF2089 family protein [Verrucomicrobiales bacterium]|nr:DUF2089 family protein [Verrucomicrobiales bacterium]